MRTVNLPLRSRRRVIALGILTAAVLIGVAAVTATAQGDKLLKGAIPPAAFGLDLDLVPDFVPALDRQGRIVGWISKYELEPAPVSAGDAIAPGQPSPVYADDLKTVVGQMFDDKGFVPIGADAGTIEDFPASAAPAR
jgi:hypothetical protein